MLIAAPLSTRTLLTGLPSMCAFMYKGFKCWHIAKVGFSNMILHVFRHSSSSANKMGIAPQASSSLCTQVVAMNSLGKVMALQLSILPFFWLLET